MSDSLKQRVINLIRENRISTTEVADVLGKTGHVPKVLPITPRQHKVAEVAFVYAYNGSNWEVHEQLQNIDHNKIIYVHGIECDDKAIFGDLVSKYILLYKRSVAIVVNGLMRDAHTIIKENYPIWATGVSPIGCKNVKNERLPSENILKPLRDKFDGAIMVCDDSGVVLIEPHQITESLIDKLNFIELQEDVWFFCMDTHKMSTYEIVCEKKYLYTEGIIDKSKLIDLSSFSTEK